MTRDEILNMPVGREMDALVAEKVLGWQWQGFEGGYQRLYINDGDYRRYGAIREGGETEYTNNLHNYSTEMGAAWDVVEKFNNQCMLNNVHGLWECYFPGNVMGLAETAPLAICRAALLAVLEKET